MRLLSSFIVLQTLVLSQLCWADARVLYVIKGERGSVTYTSRAPAEGVQFRTLKLAPKRSKQRKDSTRIRTVRRVRQLGPLIDRVAHTFSLPPELLKAVIEVESGFRPRAVSSKGAAGLMQLMPATAARFGVRDRFHIAENVRGGAAYLRWLMDRFDDDLTLALAAYNAGEGAVDKFNGVPPYKETKNYVQKVVLAKKRYQQTSEFR